MTQIKTILWFLKRPKYYRQIPQLLKRRHNQEKENTREESTEWCMKNSISQIEAITKLTGETNLFTLSHLFPETMEYAQKQADTTPVKMGGEGAISLIYHIVNHLKPEKILETGVAYGWSSLAILLAIQNSRKARLISNDMPYVNQNNEDYVGTVVPGNLRNQWDLQRLPDISGIPLALKKLNHQLDFVHYDSDKSYTGRMWATPLLWNSLRPGGILMVDDINDNIAFREFCQSVQVTPVITEHLGKYAGIIKKAINPVYN